MPDYDAVVVGAGPNGLAAAIELSRHGRRVLVIEGRSRIGGGSRTAELTLPGFKHDHCSAVFALGHASPFLRSLPLDRYGLEWAQPEIPVAHAFEGGAAALYRDVDETAAALGRDGSAYRALVAPFVRRAEAFYRVVFGRIIGFPRHPILMARFGMRGMPSAHRLARRFSTFEARGLLAGLAAHSTSDLRNPVTGAMALVLAVAGHTEGYPFARGGSQAVVEAMAAHLQDLGGRITTGQWVSSLHEAPSSSVYLLDLAPAAAAEIAGGLIPHRRERRLGKWAHGPATFKVDYATDAPIPWSDPLLRRAGTVHVGGTFEEVAAAERAPWEGRPTDRPFLILTQPTAVDPSRAPDGKHVVWAYAHVPNGSDVDITDAITAQIERFAPGFSETVLAKKSISPLEFEAYNPNYVGGDIGAGKFGFWQIAARPRVSFDPYRLADGIYLCSAATPPGAGVHGMNGYWAARSALKAFER